MPASHYLKLAKPGDNFWWLEFGGVTDAIMDKRDITRELQRLALGYWEYIKNHFAFAT